MGGRGGGIHACLLTTKQKHTDNIQFHFCIARSRSTCLLCDCVFYVILYVVIWYLSSCQVAISRWKDEDPEVIQQKKIQHNHCSSFVLNIFLKGKLKVFGTKTKVFLLNCFSLCFEGIFLGMWLGLEWLYWPDNG